MEIVLAHKDCEKCKIPLLHDHGQHMSVLSAKFSFRKKPTACVTEKGVLQHFDCSEDNHYLFSRSRELFAGISQQAGHDLALFLTKVPMVTSRASTVKRLILTLPRC